MSNAWLSTAVRRRITERNKNWLGLICGGTGSGKSYSGLRLASNIDPSFNIDRVVFSVKEFMDVINSKKLQKGQAIVFDEAGVGIPSKQWFSVSNKLMGYLLQTFRYMNLAVIFTTPNLGYIDKQARGLFHCYIETKGINYRDSRVRAKIKLINHDMNGKMMTPYPRTYIKGTKRTLVITKYNFGMPPADLIEAYEKKKQAFGRGLNKEIGREMADMTREAASGRPSKLGAKETGYIINLINRKVPQKEIVEKVKEKFGIVMSQQGVSWLKLKFNRGIYDR